MSADLGEILLRFVIGGAIVSLFAAIAEIFRPKSFGGLFGAAPSVALATIGITVSKHGNGYAAVEARFMVLGAIAFLLYASAVSWALMRIKPRALTAATMMMPIWFAASFGLWFVVSKMGSP